MSKLDPAMFYPPELTPAQRIKTARREITLHTWSLKKMLETLAQEIKTAEKSPWPSQEHDRQIKEIYHAAVRHAQAVFRDLHQVRRAVSEHLDWDREDTTDE